MSNLSAFTLRSELSPKSHIVNDQGYYFVANSAQSGIVPTYGTSLVATSPFITVFNGATAGVGAMNLYLDYVELLTIAAGACTTTTGYTAISVVIDNGNRFSSGGTTLTAKNSNMNVGRAATGVAINCGAIVATAASANARTIVGIRNIRPGVSTTAYSAIGDENILVFGSNEQAQTSTVTLTNPQTITTPLPSIIIGPQQTALVYVWFPAMTAPSAGTFAPEIGFWLA